MLLAVVHIVGAVVVAVLSTLALGMVTAWTQERGTEQRRREVAANLGVSVEQLESEAIAPRLTEHLVSRFSSELLRNRVSDLCGWLLFAWDWLGILIQIGVLIGVIWSTVSQGTEQAAYAWSILGVAVFFWLAAAAVTLACYVVTGRRPGEARAARKALHAWLLQRNA